MEIKDILKRLPPAPPKVDEWIRKNHVKNTYIIYNKEKDSAVCTRCGHKFRASRFDMSHNTEGTCPKCESKSIYKSSGRGRKNLEEYLRVLLFTHRGNTVYATLSNIIVDFRPEGKPDLYKPLDAVYVFSETEQIYYRQKWYNHWEQVKNIRLPQPPSTINFYSEPRFSKTEVYEDNIEDVFTKSCMKYLYVNDFAERHEFTAYDYIRFINLGLKYPSIEMLLKSGFETLVINKIGERTGGGCVNWRGKNLKKILRLPMRHIRRIREYDPDFDELKTFQGLSEKDKQLPWNVVQKITEIRNGFHVKEMQQYTDIVKWSRWAAKDHIREYDWLDYIRDCEKLGLDTRKNSVLFPDDFHNLHQRLAMQIEENENAEKTEKIKRIAEKYHMDFETDTLKLIIADSQIVLNSESSALGHCVKTYGDKVAEGKTLIFFIRKKSAPEVPYYTLEIRPDGKFVQCRGKYNCGMTEDVEEFKDMVVKEFNRMLKKMERSKAA